MRPQETDSELGVETVLWDTDDALQSILNLYKHDTEFAKVKVRWYLRDAARAGRYSKSIRTGAAILGTIGTFG
jgi:hypothetical protein